jgi:hypothetical protein
MCNTILIDKKETAEVEALLSRTHKNTRRCYMGKFIIQALMDFAFNKFSKLPASFWKGFICGEIFIILAETAILFQIHP